MGRGRGTGIQSGSRARSVLLGNKAYKPFVETPEGIEGFCRIDFPLCKKCGQILLKRKCSCADMEIVVINQIPPSILVEVFKPVSIDSGYQTHYKYPLVIPAGVPIVYDNSFLKYNRADRKMVDTRFGEISDTKRKLETRKFGFQLYRESNVASTKTLITWASGNNKKGVRLDDLDLGDLGLEEYWDNYIVEASPEKLATFKEKLAAFKKFLPG